ncbi:MAG: AMP-binding protein [Thermoplasmataceae archaeon]
MKSNPADLNSVNSPRSDLKDGEQEGYPYFEEFRKVCEQFPSYAAVVYGGNVHSFGNLLKFVESFSSGLKKLFPIKKGDRVVISLPPGLPFIISVIAMSRIGLVAVPMEPYLSGTSFMESITKLNPSGIIATEGLLNHYENQISSEIFVIGVSKYEFISPRNRRLLASKTATIDKEKGRKNRNIFESLCYSEITSSESIDPINDIFFSRCIPDDDKKWRIINFSYESVSLSIKANELALKNASRGKKFFIAAEVYSVSSIITCILYPLLRGSCIIFESTENKKAIEKITKRFNPDVVIAENYLEENIHPLKKGIRKLKPQHILIFQEKRNNDTLMEIFRVLKPRVTGVRWDERCGTPITIIDSVDIHPEFESDGKLFSGLIAGKIEDITKQNAISISGKQICLSVPSGEDIETSSMYPGSIALNASIVGERYLKIDDNIIRERSQIVYISRFSEEIKKEISSHNMKLDSVTITIETGMNKRNIILVESADSKAIQSRIISSINYIFPRFLRSPDIVFVESIPRSMSGMPILNLIYQIIFGEQK